MPTQTDVFAKVRGHEREALLKAAREADLMPYFRTVESPAMPVVEMEGQPRIMLASNNYLGLTGDERVMQGARDALARYGTGLTGSRLLNGTTPLHLELERELAEWMGTEDALVFTTGHQANVGTLGTLLDAKDTVIVDSADHASILDGALLSKAKLRPFRHNRMDKLARALERASADGGGVLVVVDGVFSMEGDVAPLVDIVELCEHHGARLMVDEAHGAGVLGARGAGACELLGVEDRVDLRMGTFSKSLAACGGFLAGPAEVIDYLRISSRAFLFTASAVPAALGAALAALRIVRSEEGPQLLERVLDNARYLSAGLRALGYRTLTGEAVRVASGTADAAPRGATDAVLSDGADESPSGPDEGAADVHAHRSSRDEASPLHAITTPIVPVLVGDDWKAALLWRALYERGVFTNCALHPAVPPGGALLRTSVMATHDHPTIDRALEAFAAAKHEFEAEHGPLPTADAGSEHGSSHHAPLPAADAESEDGLRPAAPPAA
jgi:8-amino-7-oxononanoate synthase